MGPDRPLDLLNEFKNKGTTVVVERKGRESRPIVGKLIAFDIHINLAIESEGKLKFVRGDIIETITPGN